MSTTNPDPNVPLFDQKTGKPIRGGAPKRAAVEAPTFETTETEYFGMPIRVGLEHPLIPSHEIVERYQLNTNNPKEAHRVNTIKLFALGHPLFLVGETGCGKTEIVKFCCAKTRTPLYQVQGHAHLEWEDLVGRFILQDGNSVYVPGPLALALREGACFLLDECASVKQGILNGLNELANGGDLVVDNGEGHVVIKRADGFRLVMTANPWDNYAGNNELNIAYLDRFKVRQFPYMSADDEINLLQRKYPSINVRVITSLVKFAAATRTLKEKNPDSVRYIVSTRTLQNVCDMITQLNCTPLEAVTDCVLSIVKLTAMDEYKVIEEKAKNTVAAAN